MYLLTEQRIRHSTINILRMMGVAIVCVALVGCAAGRSGDATTNIGDERARQLIETVQQKTGDYQSLLRSGDVEYTYVYHDPADGKRDISTERYIFNGERSWGRYEVHDKHVMPGRPGVVVQGFDGQEAWVTLDGKPVTDGEAIDRARFSRKTNFYWFAMMQKLLDPGVRLAYEGQRTVDGRDYDIVRMTFDAPPGPGAGAGPGAGPGAGMASDTYLLYINPRTGLIDQFLFTVVDFGMVDEPLLMRVKYERFIGVMIPTDRRYTRSNWAGQVLGDVWIEEICEDVRFGVGIDPSIFEKR